MSSDRDDDAPRPGLPLGAAPRRRDVLRWMGGSLGAASLSSLLPLTACDPREPRRDRPNIVLIMADDLGYGDLGCYGAVDVATPRIDGLAARGVRFTDFYAAPQCTAARIATMTGSYARRAGDLRRTGVGTVVGIHDGEVTIAELLRERGYATHLVGKWHLGMHPVFSPLNHGFDSFFGMLTSNGQNPPLMRGLEVEQEAPDQTTLTERYTREAMRWIEHDRDRPFFLFLSHLMPHVPLAVPEAWQGRSRRGLYGDAVELVDWSTGQVLAALEEQGLSQSTLVVFCSDNGPWLARGADGGSAGLLRGGKGEVAEGGVRVPCAMRWTGTLPPGHTCREVCGLIDLLPTFAHLAGASLPSDRVLDGRDIWPLAMGEAGATSPHEHFYFFKGSSLRAVRRGRWKYHLGRGGGSDDGALYDLKLDPGETKDVRSRHRGVAAELAAQARRFEQALVGEAREPGRAPA